jgi:hypothetical protein
MPCILAVVTILLAVYGMMSYDWYEESREIPSSEGEGNYKSDLGYGPRGVHNYTRLAFNGSTLDEEESVQTYEEFNGPETEAGPVADTMFQLLIIGIVMTVLFIPLAYISQTSGLEGRVGKWGPYIPLYVAQVAAITLILAPIWFSYEFVQALDMDAMRLTNAPSQALGAMAGWWVIFGGIVIQVAALMAISRTRLIYIEPLDEAKTPEPIEDEPATLT